MSTQTNFPDLQGFEPTRATLHAYSKVVGAMPRALAEPHPKWWHISLKIHPGELVTDEMKMPSGDTFYLAMNFVTHTVDLCLSTGERPGWRMDAGLTANQLAEQLIHQLEELGLAGDYNYEKFQNDEPRAYDPRHADAFFRALTQIDAILKQHRERLSGDRGPVQLWPHGFDIAFEWFGTRSIQYEEDGHKTSYPAQINFGFSPGEASHPQPYFYSNPFPFEDEKLVGRALPHGARWFTESWKGSLFEYASLVGDPEAGQKLLDYYMAVYEIAWTSLVA